MPKKVKKIIPFLIIALGAGLLAWGYVRGEMSEIYTKGARICFECIGLVR